MTSALIKLGIEAGLISITFAGLVKVNVNAFGRSGNNDCNLAWAKALASTIHSEFSGVKTVMASDEGLLPLAGLAMVNLTNLTATPGFQVCSEGPMDGGVVLCIDGSDLSDDFIKRADKALGLVFLILPEEGSLASMRTPNVKKIGITTGKEVLSFAEDTYSLPV